MFRYKARLRHKSSQRSRKGSALVCPVDPSLDAPTVCGENRFLSLLDHSIQGVLIHDYQSTPLFVNQGYANQVGHTVDEILNLKSVFQLYCTNEVPRLQGYLQQRLASGSKASPPTVYEVAAKHKNESKVILQNSVSLIEWQGVPAVFISAIDVTDRYLAQQALKLSEERFRDFAESSSDWCWEMDEKLCFSYISESFSRIAQCCPEEFIGLTRKEFMMKSSGGRQLTDEEIQSWNRHLSTLAARRPFSNFEYSWYRRDGSMIVISTNGKPVFNESGTFCGYRGTGTNITDAKELSKKLNYQASHDELTGLLNRRYFDAELHRTIEDSVVNNTEHVLIYMDLDRFKIVNDTCGHVAGDELLQQLSAFFKKIFSRRDVLARLGGDEFAVILRHCTIEQSMRITSVLHDEINRFRFVWNDKTFTVGVSAGIAAIDRNSESVSRLLQNVDSACYIAKENGRNKSHVFSENDEDLSKRQNEMQWAGRITQALEQSNFSLYAQPIVPLNTSDDVFYELLIRMDYEGKIIAPSKFLPAAERYDLSLNVDMWVLQEALSWIKNCQGFLSDGQLIFINLSGKTIGKDDFLDWVVRLLKKSQVRPSNICFEITETTAIANLSKAVGFIEELKAIGCHFALDDFGSGISSFGYLKNLPVDFLKIDGVFIKEVSKNAVNLAMIKSINEISHVMGKQTIAEYVEDDVTFGTLRNLGVDYAQGYAAGHPVPLEKLFSGNKHQTGYEY